MDEATVLTLEDVDLKNHRVRLRRLKNGITGVDEGRLALRRVE